MSYKTPNVYVEEVSTLPPSVAGVATAIPAFIGYTEKAEKDGETLDSAPTRIRSLKEFEDYFGKAPETSFSVSVAPLDDESGEKTYVVDGVNAPPVKLSMHYGMRMFFNNGGESCYIISVGQYGNGSGPTPSKENLIKGLNELKKEDEPTLILFPDGHALSSAADYYEVCQQALAQCKELKDRFTIIDVVKNGDGDIQSFRNSIGMNALKYGAAYYPYIQTSLNHAYSDDSVAITGLDGIGVYKSSDNGMKVTWAGPGTPALKIAKKAGGSVGSDVFSFSISEDKVQIECPSKGEMRTIPNLLNNWNAWNTEENNPERLLNIEQNGDGSDTIDGFPLECKFEYPEGESSLASIKNENTDLYNKIKAELNKKRIVLPPSSAVAGIYASVDRDRGVWKAPANVGLSSVIGPTVKITDKDQENLNVDATSGKSINAIRAFTGKGTLVWGARTLAGNDNEWRYIPVRRLFNYIEESIQKATSFAVFEPNTAMTWLKVRTMAESFLDNLWRRGALAGAAPDQAYFVHVGLGSTMTSQDILEGRMIVEIGVAAVRPAEFIILRFSHKLQEA